MQSQNHIVTHQDLGSELRILSFFARSSGGSIIAQGGRVGAQGHPQGKGRILDPILLKITG